MVDETNFKVASVADIGLFVTQITFAVTEIIIKEDMITSSVARITYIVAGMTFKVAVVTYSVAKITSVVNETIFKVAVITFFSGQDYFCNG